MEKPYLPGVLLESSITNVMSQLSELLIRIEAIDISKVHMSTYIIVLLRDISACRKFLKRVPDQLEPFGVLAKLTLANTAKEYLGRFTAIRNRIYEASLAHTIKLG